MKDQVEQCDAPVSAKAKYIAKRKMTHQEIQTLHKASADEESVLAEIANVST